MRPCCCETTEFISPMRVTAPWPPFWPRCCRLPMGATRANSSKWPARRCSNSLDRKSTRLNSSHLGISYAVFCLNEPLPPQIYALSLHDALPISDRIFDELGKDATLLLRNDGIHFTDAGHRAMAAILASVLSSPNGGDPGQQLEMARKALF